MPYVVDSSGFQAPVERKSTLKLSDSEEEIAGPPPKLPTKRTESKSVASARVKRGVVISDDEDEKAPKLPRAKAAYKAKAKAASPDLEAEKELRAMMDIDDGMRLSLLYELSEET